MAFGRAGLGVGDEGKRGAGGVGGAGGERSQASAVALGRGMAERLADRRYQVDGADEVGDDPPVTHRGPAHQERHVQQLVVERLPVEELAVIPELLTVIGRDDDERGVEAAAPREAAQQAADLTIDVREVAVVEVDDALAVGRVVLVLPGAGHVVEGEADGRGRGAVDEAAGEARRRGRAWVSR